MAFAPGREKTGGRAKGVPNVRTRALWDALTAAGFREGTNDDPALFLWMVQTGRQTFPRYIPVSEPDERGIKRVVGEQKVLEPAPMETRVLAAGKLMGYCYPSRKPVDADGDDTEKHAVSWTDFATLPKGPQAVPEKKGVKAEAAQGFVSAPPPAAALVPRPTGRGRAPRPKG